MRFLIFASLWFGFASPVISTTQSFFKNEFKNAEGCFVAIDIDSGKTIDSYNPARCQKRYAPMSTFKVPLLVMAFESGYFKTADQEIKWDGKDRGRKSVNRNQTPKTFISRSVIWVSHLIINYLGKPAVSEYLRTFDYGNKLVSGDFQSFWLTAGSVKISAKEQVQFLSRLWRKELSLKATTYSLAKEATINRNVGGWNVYGKTGTGCIDKGCMNKPGRQLGWFVGVMEMKNKTVAFALNFSDKIPQKGYGGLRARKIFYRYLKQSPLTITLNKTAKLGPEPDN